VPALDPIRGLRIVADPTALDAARLTAVGADPGPVATDIDRIIVLRFAPDDAFALGATAVDVDDEHAIVEDEPGFVGGWCSLDDLRRHLEWSPPGARPVLCQGLIAGVPAKLWLPDDDDALLLTAVAFADVLSERLGWRR